MNDVNQMQESGDAMKKILKRAVESQEVPPHLEMKIRAAIRESGNERKTVRANLWAWMIPSLGAAAMAAAALFFYFGRSGNGPVLPDPDTYIATMTAKVAPIMRVGLGDHIHCAFFRKYPKEPKPVQEMKQELGPEYAALLDAVKATAPADFSVQLAHKCKFRGRQFVHLVLKNDDRLMSVVVTAKGDGETFAADQLVPALAQSGISFYKQGADAYQIAAYENSKHIVYLISDLPQDRNMQTLLAMADGLNSALPKS